MRIKSISFLAKDKLRFRLSGYLCLYFFVAPLLLQAQKFNKKDLLSLSSVIIELEDRWSPYIFTYADDVIKDIFVVPPPEGMEVKEGVAFLEKQCNLTFSIINSDFISITRKDISLRSICGTLYDAETNSIISEAFIEADNYTTISNHKGEFTLDIPETTSIITIKHLGYRTQEYATDLFDAEGCSPVYIFKSSEALDEVIINNFITKGIGKTKSGSFKIDYEDFGSLPGLIETDVLQTIQALPGVQSADETISNINIRGGTHDQNLILWDGIKMYQSGHFFGLISVFNPNITEEATILKNGSSSEFTDGVSGTILMHSNDKINKEFKAEVGVNLINADVFTDIPLGKKSSLQLSARKSLNEFITTPTYNRYFERISQNSELEENSSSQEFNKDILFDFYDTNVRWNYHISEKDKLRLNFILIGDELVFNENATIDDVLTSKKSSLTQESIAGGVFYQRNWNNRFTTYLQAYETFYNLNAINANVIEDRSFLQENTVSETGVKIKATYLLNANANLTGGYQFIESGITDLTQIDVPAFIERTVRVIRTHGVFTEFNYEPVEKDYNFNLGLRYSYNEKFKAHFIEPRLSYSHKFLDHFNLQIQGELKHQNSTQIIRFQNDFLGIERRRWLLATDLNSIVEDLNAASASDISIPLTEGRQASLGLSYNRNGLLISGEGYFKNIIGITSESQGFQNEYRDAVAEGTYTVTGFELLANKRFKNISTWIGYTYAINNYDFDTPIDQSFPNTVDIRHSASLGAVYTKKGVKVSAGINWHSGLPTTLLSDNQLDENGAIQFAQENSSRLKQYFRADFSASYDFKISDKFNGNAGVSLWNLADTDNIVSSFYRINDDSEIEQQDIKALRLTPNAVFRISF